MIWQPDPARIEKSVFHRWEHWLQQNRQLTFPDYAAQWQWSVKNPGDFWEAIADFFHVRFHTPPQSSMGRTGMPGTEWFPGATLNYAEHVFSPSDPASPVLACLGEEGSRLSLTRNELAQRVTVLARELKSVGIGRGDCVAGYLPNTLETVVAFLATASLGAIWSNSPVELKPHGVVERLTQIQPKVLIASLHTQYNGKPIDLTESVREILHGLPSLNHAYLVGEIESFSLPGLKCSSWQTLPWAKGAPLHFEPVPFDHPLWILFSSGTSGTPKAIVQSHGGILLEHLKSLALHLDLQPGDRFLWYTTAGWMMWNFLVSGLLLPGVTIYLYDGSPKYPDFSALWQLVACEKITVFGTSAPFLLACLKEKIIPREECDLTDLRTIGSTGAPLPAEGFDWVYRAVKEDVLLAPISGGTDFCTAVVTSHPAMPVHRGEMQCLALGADIQSWDDEGRHAYGRVGELVIPTPLPSMPTCFWNDPDGSRLMDSYFTRFPGVWHHGDWIEIRSVAEGVVISGRSDSTLNRDGVRMGTAEFYAVVEAHPSVDEALVVDTSQLGQDGRLLLFLKMSGGKTLTPEIKSEIISTLRKELSPRHVPDQIESVPGIPHSLNGKKLEIPVKRLFSGFALSDLVTPEALAACPCLAWYEEFAKQTALPAAP